MTLSKAKKIRRKQNKERRKNYVSKPIEILPNPHKIGDQLYCHTTFPLGAKLWRLWTAGVNYTVDNAIQDQVWIVEDEGDSCLLDLWEVDDIFHNVSLIRERKLKKILND